MLQTNKSVPLLSSYRPVQTNNSLRAKSEGVAKDSYHSLGKAIDFYIEGTRLSLLRKAGLKLRMGGVDDDPRSNFVDIDTVQARTG